MSDAERREFASAQFDPFQAWLGFPEGELPADYYALFGLPRFEEDFDVIRAAADKLTAEVRQIRPGNRLAEWTRLLDLLTTAGQTLRDPAQKEEYDRALRAGRIPPLAKECLHGEPVEAAPPQRQSSEPRSTPIAPASPITRREEPEGAVATVLRPILLSPASSQPEPQVEAPPHWRRLTQRRSWLPRLVAMILLVAAVVVSIHMMQNREAWSAWFAKQWPRRLDTVAGMRTPPAATANKEPAKSHQPNHQTSRVNSDEPTDPQRPAVPPPKPKRASGAVSHPPPADNRVKPPSPDSNSEGTNPVGLPQGTGNVPSPPATDTRPSAVPTRPSQPGAVPTQAAASQNPNNPDTANESEPSQQDTATALSPEMVPLVAGIWDALGRRDLPAARAQLNSLASRVRTPAERDLAEALDFLVRHVEAFWQSFQKIMHTLKAGEEFAVGDSYIIVVDTNENELVVRAEGRNFHFTLRNMPTSLVRLIVARRFRPGANTDVLYGAFLAVDPKGDPQQAAQLWRSAASQGFDTDLLLKALRHRPSKGRPGEQRE